MLEGRAETINLRLYHVLRPHIGEFLSSNQHTKEATWPSQLLILPHLQVLVTGWVVCCVVSVCVFLVTQSRPTLCNPCKAPRQWNFPGKNTGVGCHSLLQGIFLTQGPNPGLLHYRHIFHCLSHQRRPQAESCVSHKSYIEVLTPSTAKCDCIWKEVFFFFLERGFLKR